MYEDYKDIENLNCALYQRKSTEDEDRQVASIEDQYKDNVEVINRYNLKLTQSHTYKESKSAKQPGREMFAEMVKEIESGKVEVIVTWHPNRLARNGEDAGKIIQLLSDGKIKAILTPHKSFFNSGNDRLMLYIDFGISDKYSKDLSEVVMRGMKSKALRGWWPGNPKTGYLNKTVFGVTTQITDPERFPILRLAIEKYLTGLYSVRKIVDYTNNDLGFKTRKTKKIGNKPMVISKMYKLLEDPFYYGKIEWGGVESWLDESCERLMTEEEYWKIQDLLGKKGKPRPKKYFNLPYRGIFKCGTCGGEIIPYIKNKTLKNGCRAQYTYIKCTRNKRSVDCKETQISLKDFETQILNILGSIKISNAFYEWALKWIKIEHSNQKSEQDLIIKNLTKNLESYQEKLNRLIDIYSDGLINKNEFTEQKIILEKERKETKQKLDSLESRTDSWIDLAKNTIDFSRYAQERFIEGDWETKMTIVTALGSNFYMKGRILYIDLEKPFFEFKNNYEVIHANIPKVELDKSLDITTNKDNLSPELSQWWGGWESNPHSRFFRPVP